jgi:hypothetical protein
VPRKADIADANASAIRETGFTGLLQFSPDSLLSDRAAAPGANTPEDTLDYDSHDYPTIFSPYAYDSSTDWGAGYYSSRRASYRAPGHTDKLTVTGVDSGYVFRFYQHVTEWCWTDDITNAQVSGVSTYTNYSSGNGLTDSVLNHFDGWDGHYQDFYHYHSAVCGLTQSPSGTCAAKSWDFGPNSGYDL